MGALEPTRPPCARTYGSSDTRRDVWWWVAGSRAVYSRRAQNLSSPVREYRRPTLEKNDGWLGAPGTECNWYGVRCGIGELGYTVQELDLYDNGLKGSIPEALGALNHLRSLTLAENRLSGMLPEALIRRWWAEELDFVGNDSLLTNVSEIDFESASTSLLCASHRVIIRADGTAVSYTKRCRNARPNERVTFCDVQKAKLYWHEFAKVARLLERNGFYGLKAEHSRTITDAAYETTVVTRAGTQYKVGNYADAGPMDLWEIQRAIEGVASNIGWEDAMRIDHCPVLWK